MVSNTDSPAKRSDAALWLLLLFIVGYYFVWREPTLNETVIESTPKLEQSQGELIYPDKPWRRGQRVEILTGEGSGIPAVIVGYNHGNGMLVVDYSEDQIGWVVEVDPSNLKPR